YANDGANHLKNPRRHRRECSGFGPCGRGDSRLLIAAATSGGLLEGRSPDRERRTLRVPDSPRANAIGQYARSATMLRLIAAGRVRWTPVTLAGSCGRNFAYYAKSGRA